MQAPNHIIFDLKILKNAIFFLFFFSSFFFKKENTTKTSLKENPTTFTQKKKEKRKQKTPQEPPLSIKGHLVNLFSFKLKIKISIIKEQANKAGTFVSF